MTYRFLSSALAEIADACRFYEDKVPGLGGDLLDEVDSAMDRILRFPNAWGRLSDNYRHCSLRRFPYTIIYLRESDTAVLVVSVFHQSREPLSWMHDI